MINPVLTGTPARAAQLVALALAMEAAAGGSAGRFLFCLFAALALQGAASIGTPPPEK